MRAETRALADTIRAARVGVTALPDDTDPTDLPADATVVRVRTNRPDRTSADSSYIGTYREPDAWTVAGKIAAATEGTISQCGSSIEVRHGRPGVLLSMRQVAERAGLAESTVRTYRARGGMPDPDEMIGVTPGWLEQTIDPWIASLPGRGARTDLAS